MRTMELKVYKFSELSEEAKKKVLGKYWDWNVSDGFWYECIFEYWKEKLEMLGFEEADIAFSGFNSQGDGACFDAKVNAAVAAKALGFNEAEVMAVEMTQPCYKIENVNHHYSHYNCRDVQYQGEWANYSHRDLDAFEKVMNTPVNELPLLIGALGEEDPSLQTFLEARLKLGLDIRPDLFTKLEEAMEEKREELSKELYRDLEKEYDFQTAAEQIIESLEANEKEFDEDGDEI